MLQLTMRWIPSIRIWLTRILVCCHSRRGLTGLSIFPNYYTIPKAIENPEQIIYLWEKIYDIESIYDYPRQADLEKWFQNEADVANAKAAGESIRVIEGIDAYPSMPYYEFVGELREGVSVSTVIEKYKEPFQAAADEIWK